MQKSAKDNPPPKAKDVTEIPNSELFGTDLHRTRQQEVEAEAAALRAKDKKRDEAQRRLLSKQPQEKVMQTQTHTTSKKAPVKVLKKIQDAVNKPKVQKALVKTAKAVKAKNGKAKQPVHRDAGPSGMAAKVLKLAARPEGATRAELIKLTGWEQQAWKWGFENKHNTGWAQRHGYTLKVIERKDGTTAYKVTPKK